LKTQPENSVTELLSGGGNAIPLFKVHMSSSVMEPLKETLMSGYIGQGPKTETFERLLGLWFDNEKVVALNSGTAAIHIALRLAGVSYGDEVISTPMTCSATNEPVLAMGAKVVWADIDPWTGNIDPEDVKRKITKKTKAIICMDWGGYPCELADLSAIATEHGIKLIEDACQAFDSRYHDKRIGCLADYTCFSFQAIKFLTTGDGGALACLSDEDYQKAKLLRWFGIDRDAKGYDLRCEADISEYGYKYQMNDIAATIGIENLKDTGNLIWQTRHNASAYNDMFGTLDTVKLLRYTDDRRSNYWLYTMRVDNRAGFVEHMKNAGITVSKVHSRNDLHTIFADSRCDLPGVDEFDSKQISIPVGWWINLTDRNYIVGTILNWEGKKWLR